MNCGLSNQREKTFIKARVQFNFKIKRHTQSVLLSLCLATLVVGSGRADIYTYTRGGAGETTGFLTGMSIDQSNFIGGTFGTTATPYPAVNFNNHKAGTAGVQLIFSIPTGAYRFDIP